MIVLLPMLAAGVSARAPVNQSKSRLYVLCVVVATVVEAAGADVQDERCPSSLLLRRRSEFRLLT